MTFISNFVPAEMIPYVNILACLIGGYFLFKRMFRANADIQVESVSTSSVKDSSEPIVFTTYTPSTLIKFNGVDDERVFLAVKGIVYDVSAGKKFYGPGGPYANFAGHDASRGLAKNSFDIEVITPIDQPIDLLKDLTDEEIEAMNGWAAMFAGKYLVVGELKNESEI
ncbi:cytochrome b5 [Nadsonia fulvescens var. elongata DSM 6958]|uniref:Cytochrome b5 n=1 Tax=Nadsonia fulvescens var. elongata DSM 6958 TaxID=857566 RepID=A0A1E3PJZ3_9ASCO|nr:cytochrome b5 [Nadsonia fulvescens var. elongata DSM 6958]